MYLAVDRQPHTRQKSLFSCSFLSRISRKSSLLSFPIISKHSPDIKSELPGVQDPEGHSIKSDHSQTGGGGRPLPTKGFTESNGCNSPCEGPSIRPGGLAAQLTPCLGGFSGTADSCEVVTVLGTMRCPHSQCSQRPQPCCGGYFFLGLGR